MSKTAHTLYILTFTVIVLIVLGMLILHGYDYYRTPLEERFYQVGHQSLKPSGIVGHGLGIAGSLAMLIGVSTYMARKRIKGLARFGRLKYWLEFHIFLCTLGPILVLFHTSFKFGGLVAISFWSMVAVFASGIIGRFIYIQIPRTLEGREMSLQEIQLLKRDAGDIAEGRAVLSEEIRALLKDDSGIARRRSFWGQIVSSYPADLRSLRRLRKRLKETTLAAEEQRKILRQVRHELSLNRRISRLNLMQDLFKYWHVAHLPFALVMLIIMIIHVVVTIIFGYRWIW